MFNKIAIVGVGLIGGSIGLAVKKQKIAKEVVGIGRRNISIKKALDKKSIDKGTLSIKDGLSGADLIIIATPVDKVMPKIKEIVKHAQKGAIIIDVNSTKEMVADYGDRAVKEREVFFVPTHPMAGSDQAGVTYAQKDLFEDSICIITPTRSTDKEALNVIRRFWEVIGADVVLMSPKLHDQAVSNISHLPHLIAYALCKSTTAKDMNLSGNGFKDTTRIAKSLPHMWADIFIQNKKSLLNSIAVFKKSLSKIESDIKKNKRPQLIKKLNDAKNKRDLIK